jgi:hypothetical protein
MSDEAQGASNAPAEGVTAPVEQTNSAPGPAATPEPSEPEAPSKSTRLALERAMSTIETPEGETAKAGRERKPDGTFAAKPVTLQPGKPGEPVKVVDANAPAVPGAAPSRFTKAAQDAWATTPEPVKVEVERAINEMTQGIEKYKVDAEAHQPFKQFAELSKQNNVEPTQALKNYVEIDKLLYSDPLNGLLQVCQKTNINPVAAAQAILKQFGGPQQEGAAPEVSQLQQIIGQLNNEIAGLKGQFGNFTQTYQQQQYQARLQNTQQSVEQFATAHPHFAEVAPVIEQLIQTGFAKDLPDAYEKAVRLTPEVFSKIEQAKAAQAVQPNADQTRLKAEKSITGTPSNGSNPASRKASGSPRESVANAFAQVGL